MHKNLAFLTKKHTLTPSNYYLFPIPSSYAKPFLPSDFSPPVISPNFCTHTAVH